MKRIIFTLASFFLAIQIHAQQGEIFTASGKAINGIDPVAYFTESAPVKGYDSITLKWKDADWYFSSKKNMELFRAEPEKYAPQFGGYCAFGMSNGYKAKTDPQAWSIVNGRLFLNYNPNVQTKWRAEQNIRIPKADSLWPAVKTKNK